MPDRPDRLCSPCDHNGHTCAAFGCAQEVDGMGLIERLECPEHGADNLVGRRCAAWERPYVSCGRVPVMVEYVPARQLAGAVGIIETARQELRDAIADGNPQILREYAEDAVEAMSAYLGRPGGQ